MLPPHDPVAVERRVGREGAQRKERRVRRRREGVGIVIELGREIHEPIGGEVR